MSIGDIERGLIARYLARILERGDLPLRTNRYFLHWLNDRTDLLNLPMPANLSKTIGSLYGTGFSVADFEKAYRKNREPLISQLRSVAEETPRPEPVATNVEMLVRELGLSHVAWKIVGLIACFTRYEQVQYLCQSASESLAPLSRTIAVLTGEPMKTVEQLLTPTSELFASGLVQFRSGFDEISGHSGRYIIPGRLDACLDHTFDNFASVRRALLGEPLVSKNEISDYDHVKKDRDLIVSVIRGAVDAEAEGVNILLYGAPGSGKTELTKIAAKTASVDLYGAGEEVSGDGETDRSGRLADLVFALRLAKGAGRTALLFDEMEDVAWQLMKRGGSKLYLNRLLESNPVPVLWTSNNIHEIDPALLRRMTLAIELKRPPVNQRQKILRRLSDRVGVELNAEEVEQLARRLDATPAVLENALKAAKFSAGGSEAVERAALGIVRAVSGVRTQRDVVIPDFDPVLSQASLDLLQLRDQLASSGNLAFSLCLSGPPGTGKSAFSRHLAQTLGLELMHKRASDLLGAYVGESEKRIADAFEEAVEAGAFLVFDEADSFLFDRAGALRSWEITQVNEMLTWMEEHPLPVCFTTNLMDRMDPASLRRFTFHVRFKYLDKPALEYAYKVFFNQTEIPADGLAFENLTPGDFAQARKQAVVLGAQSDLTRIIALLADISRTKPGPLASIGFMN